MTTCTWISDTVFIVLTRHEDGEVTGTISQRAPFISEDDLRNLVFKELGYEVEDFIKWHICEGSTVFSAISGRVNR